MPPFEENTPFEDLPLKVYRSLVKELNKNSEWKVVAKYLAEKVDYFGMSWVDSSEEEESAENVKRSPAELLLHDLLNTNTCITVGMFCDMLKHCSLLDALFILQRPDHSVTVENPYSSSSGRVIEVLLGDTISITCKATGLPSPKYQWFHANIELLGQTANSLSLLITSRDQEGDYNCRVSQYDNVEELISEEYSECASLTIKLTCPGITAQSVSIDVKSTESKDNWTLHEETRRNLQLDQLQRQTSRNINEVHTDKSEAMMDYLPQKATTKVALLIANSNYHYRGQLSTAENDAAVLATLLKKIGFHVICLQNLTLKEMRNAVQIFCAALIPDSYGLFYFVGRGFKTQGFHMMPINVFQTFLPSNAYSENELLSNALKKRPALLVVILDMVLTVPPTELNSRIHNKIPNFYASNGKSTYVLAHSTCSHEYPYERNNARNGIYVSHLSKHITSNKSVCELFLGVAQSVTESMKGEAGSHESMLTIIPAAPQRYLTDEVIHEVSGLPSPCNSYLTHLTSFRPKTVGVKFPQSSVSCQVTVQPMRAPYLNVVLLTTSGLEDWDVSFHNSHDSQSKLCPMDRKCSIYNPQRITTWEQGSLVIKIGKNGRVHKSIRFSYMKYIPKLVNALWRE